MEFLKLLLVGVLSGLIVLAAGWYYSDMRDSLRIGLKVEDLKEDVNNLQAQVSSLVSSVSTLSAQFARIDERTKVTSYNQQKFNQTVESKNIPQPKIDSAKQFLNSMPSTKDAMNYLEMNLGFSPEEAKAAISLPHGDAPQMLKQNDLKR